MIPKYKVAIMVARILTEMEHVAVTPETVAATVQVVVLIIKHMERGATTLAKLRDVLQHQITLDVFSMALQLLVTAGVIILPAGTELTETSEIKFAPDRFLAVNN
jgi:hypothetical protein